MANDIADWFNGIPFITRCWFAGTIALSLLGRIGLINGMYLILDFDLIFWHFQIWRPVTALFFYPITPQTGFHFLINLYFMYTYSTRLETGIFDGRPGDYLFMLTFCWLVTVILGFIVDMVLLMDPMVMVVMYVWCQLNKDQIVTFWFGSQFKAMYMPWVLLIFNMILRGRWLLELVGILVGHLYFFLMFKYPQEFGGQTYLKTPQIFYKYFPNRRGGVSGFGVAPTARRQEPDDGGDPRRHQWGGGGNRLG